MQVGALLVCVCGVEWTGTMAAAINPCPFHPTHTQTSSAPTYQPAFGYHPTPAEPHQYTNTHPNRYVITLAYDDRTYPVHIIVTHHAPMNPQINTHQQTRR
jgi:hypothetical protein